MTGERLAAMGSGCRARLGRVAAVLAASAVAAGCATHLSAVRSAHLSATASAGPTATASAGPTTTASADPTTTAPAAPTTTAPPPGAGQAVTVTDTQGATFSVSAQPVTSILYVTVGGGVWSASPGHTFLHQQLSVTNSSADTESLSEFDDHTSGLAGGLELVMKAADAEQQGYGLDCGVDPAFPPSLCPISFSEGITVDSDSLDSGAVASNALLPGARAQIVLSYGPVSAAVDPATVELWFVDGRSGPIELTG